MAADSNATDSKATSRAALAVHRFGLGPKPGTISAIASDPRGALLAELNQNARDVSGASLPQDLPTVGEAARDAFDFRRQRREARRQSSDATPKTNRQPNAAMNDAAPDADRAPDAAKEAQADAPQAKQAPPAPAIPQQIYFDEAKARLESAVASDLGFRERLVWFWSNHFCVSVAKNQIRPLAGAFEREAIRPHVLGRFADLLLAAESHPAMLIYLDNARSIGPNSVAGVRRGKGLNENLAREIMELHTLGVRSVYSQDDVTNFAKVITGWSVVPFRQDDGGTFTFNRNMHEPGAQRIIGKMYGEGGIEQGRAVLADLARHPATARHVATKLARHFVADEPPPALVARLEKCFLDTGGDLRAVSTALIEAPEAWSETRSKLKKPSEWLAASVRADGAPVANDPRPMVRAQALLGEPLWTPPAPNGFPDTNAAWLDGLPQRLELSNRLARRFARQADPSHVVDETLGGLASNETRQTIRRAESRPQALALLLMSPEFLRR